MPVGTDDLEAAVLGKEGDARKMIKELIKLAVRRQGLEKT
jgi:hypothetical protein